MSHADLEVVVADPLFQLNPAARPDAATRPLPHPAAEAHARRRARLQALALMILSAAASAAAIYFVLHALI